MFVWCLIIDSDRALLGSAFKVECDPGLDTDDLKTKVVASEPDLAGAHNSEVHVYHSTAVRANMGGHELEAAISELDFAKARVNPSKVVTEVASGLELLIIQKPAPRTSRKRARSPTPEIDHLSRLKRAKILQGSPSQVAQFSEYKAMQTDSSERLLDDRPQPDLGIAPISLLYGPFGEFDDIFNGRAPPPADIDIDFPPVEYRVNELATGMSLCYPTDKERRSAGAHLILGMFRFRLWGCESEAHRLVTTIATFKNLLPDAPYVECVARIARSHANSDAFKDMCGRWRIPALFIAIDGFKIMFYAVILLGHQYRVTSLTPGLSWSPQATNGRDRKLLYTAFAAAYVLQQRIHRDLDSYMQHSGPLPPVLSNRECFFPAVSKIRAHGPDATDNEYVEFQIFDDFCPEGHVRYLYCAKVTAGARGLRGNDKYIFVKFTQRYSIELHDFCAEKGHAPKVLGYERLPGGWFAIAMDFIGDALPMQPDTYSSEKENLLVSLVEGFHEKGLVHLRSVNIICKDSGDECWLVDFDWGGKAGEVEYPTWLLNEELVSGRKSNDLRIRKEDDLRILRASLATLERRKPK